MMSEFCIECGDKADTKLEHPEWHYDAVCSECHKGLWDDWIEERLRDYTEATGIDYIEEENRNA